MNGGSGGKAVVSMEDANDDMWDRLFALHDMDQLQVSSVGRTLFKLAVKANSIVPFSSRSSPVSLSSPLVSSMSLSSCVVRVWITLLAATRIVYALCACILFATSILLSLRAPP